MNTDVNSGHERGVIADCVGAGQGTDPVLAHKKERTVSLEGKHKM